MSVAGNKFSKPPLRTLLKHDPTRKGLVLIAVNINAVPMLAQFRFDPVDEPGAPSAPAGNFVTALFEGMHAGVSGGREVAMTRDATGAGWAFTDHFGPFDSHVYVLWG